MGAATIMVVDDDDDLRLAICDILGDLGYITLGQRSGDDALLELRGGTRPDAVLLDLNMPGLNGWDVREAMLADRDLAGIPVALMTAARTLDGRSMVGLEVIQKPFDMRRIADTLSRMCPP